MAGIRELALAISTTRTTTYAHEQTNTITQLNQKTLGTRALLLEICKTVPIAEAL